MCVCAQSSIHVQLFATLWTVARQAPLSMEFSSWSALPFPSAGDLPDPGIKPESLESPELEDRFFTYCTTWESQALSEQEAKKVLSQDSALGVVYRTGWTHARAGLARGCEPAQGRSQGRCCGNMPCGLRRVKEEDRGVVQSHSQPHGLQHASLPCPSPSPRVCSNSCPLSQ